MIVESAIAYLGMIQEQVLGAAVQAWLANNGKKKDSWIPTSTYLDHRLTLLCRSMGRPSERKTSGRLLTENIVAINTRIAAIWQLAKTVVTTAGSPIRATKTRPAIEKHVGNLAVTALNFVTGPTSRDMLMSCTSSKDCEMSAPTGRPA